MQLISNDSNLFTAKTLAAESNDIPSRHFQKKEGKPKIIFSTLNSFYLWISI